MNTPAHGVRGRIHKSCVGKPRMLRILARLRVIVWREKAREREEGYQMSEAWLAGLHVGSQRVPFRRIWKRRAGALG